MGRTEPEAEARAARQGWSVETGVSKVQDVHSEALSAGQTIEFASGQELGWVDTATLGLPAMQISIFFSFSHFSVYYWTGQVVR